MYEITISANGRILFDGQDFGSREDCIANWPDYAAEIATKHDAWLDAKTNPPPPTTPELMAYARQRSYEVETGGIVVGGASILTDRESQGLINGMYLMAQRDPAKVFKFDSVDGPVTLDATAATALAVAVGEHVQACFDKRAEVLAAIEAGTITTTAEIDTAFAAI